MIPGNINTDLISGADEAAYQISRSLRFNSADSAFLSRTPASAGNRRTWTFSCWVKRSLLGSSFQTIFGAGTGGNAEASIRFNSDDTLEFYAWTGSYNARLLTTQVFRDVSAWYHLVAVFDTPNTTADQRIRLYVNGIEITTFSSRTNPTQNYDGYFNNSISHTIGDAVSGASPRFFNGYLADIHFIDGQALTPSSFAETNATTGQWVPKAYSGSYGTNGFRLDFSNPFDLGNDAAGANDWTPNNLSGVSGGPTSVAAASGALPIYNTTDTYGATKGSGTRTDANSSSIVLAIPMDGANNGTTFTDESATIKGSGSAKAITRNGDTKTSTAQSKFYGSSGYFDGNGDYLTAPYSTDYNFDGDFTLECHVYFSSLPSSSTWGMKLISVGDGSTSGWHFGADPNNKISIGLYGWNSGAVVGATSVAASRWYHVALVRSSGVITIYLNGVADASATKTGTTGNSGNTALHIGTYSGTGSPGSNQHTLVGYLQDVRIYKGAAKYTSNFNPPANPQQAALIGAGNDSLVDTPTSYGTDTGGAGGEVRGNYCTANPLATTTSLTLSNGNLQVVGGLVGGATYRGNSTIGVASGKWYFEATLVSAGNNTAVGIGQSNTITQYPGQDALSYAFVFEPSVRINSNSQVSYGSALTAGDVFMCAFDLDNNKIFFGKNGTWFNSSAPASGANPAYTLSAGIYTPIFRPQKDSGTCEIQLNFGQRPFAYTAPSGFKALCDTNLPAPVVAKPNTAFDAVPYTGSSGSQNITTNFSPDLVWVKTRNSTTDHELYDTVRGAGIRLSSNATLAENNLGANGLTSFNSNGFTVPSTVNGGINGPGYTYAAWAWDAGSSTVTNTQGSITSQVRANASAGFSVVSWSGVNGANGTIGHGVGGVAPQFVILKNRGTTDNWRVYHVSVGATGFLQLASTGATITSDEFQNTPPTSSVFYLRGNTWNAASNNYIGYFFAPVAGYSAFGSYTGNGSTDGPFVWCGFRPRWVLLKSSSAAGESWFLLDTSRSPYNVSQEYLMPNSSAGETSAYTIMDILSNGFKLKTSGGGSAFNGSGATYVWAAFAESPFAYSRAR